MAAEIAQHNMFLRPVSVCSTYLKFAEDLGISRTEREVSNRKKILIMIARFITSAITIPVFTPMSIMYNTLCFTIKGSFAILTYLLDTEIFHHSHGEYVNDMNLHIAYALREIANEFFIGFISVGYSFNPDFIVITDGFITNTIEFLSITPILLDDRAEAVI